ncbi:hypothetical protein HYZ99_01830 [Candidatus Peregrinibacteria bacterium]|nr:hypothetical protein [Candidatus Peregrinibacteria bacterium]
MHKFLSLMTVGALALSSITPAIAARSPRNALVRHRTVQQSTQVMTPRRANEAASRYRVNINQMCRTKRALKRAECAHQFNRGLNPKEVKSKQRERACRGKVGLERATCLANQRRVWGENRSDSSSSSSSSAASEGSSSSASSN